jgi:hypothetical protein
LKNGIQEKKGLISPYRIPLKNGIQEKKELIKSLPYPVAERDPGEKWANQAIKSRTEGLDQRLARART